jgi:hypothetical protein
MVGAPRVFPPMKSLRFLLTASLLAGLGIASAAVARTEFPNAAQPQLAASTDGRVWLAFGRVSDAPADHAHAGEPRHGHDSSNAAPKADRAGRDHSSGHGGGHGRARTRPDGDVFVMSSADGGATFTPGVKVASVPNLMIGNRRGPRLAAHGAHLTLTVIGHELFSYTSTDGGRTWSGPATINSVPGSAHEGLHDLAAGPQGQLFVTWLDSRNGGMELWGATSTDGGRTWGRNEQLYRSPDKSICECCHPNAHYDAEGNLAVVWRNSVGGARDMWIMTRRDGARQFSTPRKLGEGTWRIDGCPHDGGDVVALGGGQFGAVWQRAGEVFAILPKGSEISMGQGKQPVAAAAGGQMLVVWQQGTDLMATRDVRGSRPAKHASEARFPAVVALPAGKGAVLAYETGPARGGSIVVERL